MLSKSEISSSYTERMKSEHAEKPLRPKEHRHILIVGMGDDNIAEGICSYLTWIGYEHVTATGVKQLNVTNDEHLDLWADSLSLYDTIIMCNGESWLDWIEDVPRDKIRSVVDNSLVGNILMTREFVRATIGAPWHKQVIYIGSMAHRAILNGSATYCAAKAGLHHFASCMGWELTPKGYTVNIIHPSNTEGTPMTEETIQGLMRYRGLDREAAEAYWGAINLKDRWMCPADIAQAVEFIMSGNAAFASGSAIELKAGQR